MGLHRRHCDVQLTKANAKAVFSARASGLCVSGGVSNGLLYINQDISDDSWRAMSVKK